MPSTLPQGCVLYYPMTEPTGTPRASSVAGAGYSLVEHGTVGSRAGLRGHNAAVFTGATGRFLSLMSCPLVARGNASWTWAGWVWFDAINGGFLVSKRDGGVGDYCLQLNGPNLFMRLDGGAGNVLGSVTDLTTMATGSWIPVRTYYDATRHVLGVQSTGAVAETAVSAPAGDSYSKVRFGAGGVGGLNGNLAGAMQGWGFWQRALTGAEWTAFVNGGAGADYPFGGTPDSPPPADRFYAHNAASGLAAFRSAVAANPPGGIDVVCWGDSITQGYLSSDNETLGFTDLIRSALQAQHGGGGRGIMPMSTINQYDSASYNYPTQRWSFDVGNNNPPAGVVGLYGVRGEVRGVSNGWSATLSSQYGDTVDLWMLEGPQSDVFDLTVDSGSPARLGTASQSSWGINRYSVATTLGTHSVKITGRGSHDAYIVGAGARVGSSGIRVQTCGFSGATAADMNTPATRLSLIAAFANPKLVVLALGENDFTQQVPVSDFKAAMEAAMVHAQGLGASVLLVAGNPHMMSAAVAQPAYDAALYQLADQYNCALIDIDKRWAYSQDDSGEDGLSSPSSNLHPTDLGHSEYAAEVLNALSAPARNARGIRRRPSRSRTPLRSR